MCDTACFFGKNVILLYSFTTAYIAKSGLAPIPYYQELHNAKTDAESHTASDPVKYVQYCPVMAKF